MNRRRLGIPLVTVTVFATGLWVGISSAGWVSTHAEPIALKAALSAGAEVPKPKGAKTGAGGSFSGGLTRKSSGGTLAWRLTFRQLTGSAGAAHIHLGKPGKAGGVAVPLCGPCRSGARGSARVNARTVTALLNGGAYVNVHTARNPAGEIRGQVRKGGKAPAGTGTDTTTDTTTTTTTTYDPYP
jgi:CHRD domain